MACTGTALAGEYPDRQQVLGLNTLSVGLPVAGRVEKQGCQKELLGNQYPRACPQSLLEGPPVFTPSGHSEAPAGSGLAPLQVS